MDGSVGRKNWSHEHVVNRKGMYVAKCFEFVCFVVCFLSMICFEPFIDHQPSCNYVLVYSL